MNQMSFDAAAAAAVEAVYLTPDVVAQRARVLELLAVGRGERVLDVGVGPGLLARDLAQAVGPTGFVAGIDVAQAMLDMAAKRLAGVAHVSIKSGEATALPFDDGAFDVGVSTQVYEYVADMPLALAELHRVLRPGGRALILDTDWRSIVWHSSDSPRMERILTCWDAHLADPHLPAKLGPLLSSAGFKVESVEVLPMLSAGWRPVSYAAGMLQAILGFVRSRGPAMGVTEDEIEAWHADQLSLIERGEFFFSVNRYAFVARR